MKTFLTLAETTRRMVLVSRCTSMTANAIALKPTFSLRAATAEMMLGSDCAQVFPVESFSQTREINGFVG
ncbi:MAG TPA: hypothetical protein VNY07_12990 [Chthoniobacterales bacterium]|jgi:hypothetical protein|nr:hypothetical protein [Chthoniobacterales bacterium]